MKIKISEFDKPDQFSYLLDLIVPYKYLDCKQVWNLRGTIDFSTIVNDNCEIITTSLTKFLF